MSCNEGPSLAEPAFPNDDGLTDPSLVEVLTDPARVLARVAEARIFTPVVAVLLDDPEVAAVEGDKNSEMAAVFMTGADGRKALLAFTSVATMSAWNQQARPVSVFGKDAAQAALDDGASAMLLDLGSPNFHVIETDDLMHLAAGHQLVQTPVGSAWIEPAT